MKVFVSSWNGIASAGCFAGRRCRVVPIGDWTRRHRLPQASLMT